jgi:hypothetical protein
MTEPETSQDEVLQQVQQFVIQEIKAGADRATIAHRLAEQGVDRATATQLVDALYPAIVEAVRREQFSPSALLPALAGGLGAAVLGGIVWGLLAIWTGYEVGIVAWGLGFLAGFGVVTLAGGRKGTPLQVIAVLSSVLGIAVGKYVAFFHALREHVGAEYGAEAAADLSVFSAVAMSIFAENAGSLLSGFDLLWVVLAVVTAWRIPAGMGVTLPSHEHV